MYPIGSIIRWQWRLNPSSSDGYILLVLRHQGDNYVSRVLHAFDDSFKLGSEGNFGKSRVSRLIASSEAEWIKFGRPTTEVEVIDYLYQKNLRNSSFDLGGSIMSKKHLKLPLLLGIKNDK